MRDYIHVVDLAQGHVAALKRLEKGCGCKVIVASLNTIIPDLIPENRFQVIEFRL